MTRARDVATQGGLVLITSATIGTTVSSVTVSNCFSATYENYLVTLTGGVGNQQSAIRIQFNNSTGSTYSRNGIFQTYVSTTLSGDVGTGGTSSYIGMMGVSGASFTATIFQPFATKSTLFTSQYATGNEASIWNGYDSNAVSNTGFILFPTVGTLTGGTIRVYGIRN